MPGTGLQLRIRRVSVGYGVRFRAVSDRDAGGQGFHRQPELRWRAVESGAGADHLFEFAGSADQRRTRDDLQKNAGRVDQRDRSGGSGERERGRDDDVAGAVGKVAVRA